MRVKYFLHCVPKLENMVYILKQLGLKHLYIDSHLNFKIWSEVNHVSFQPQFFILLESGPTNANTSEIIHL